MRAVIFSLLLLTALPAAANQTFSLSFHPSGATYLVQVGPIFGSYSFYASPVEGTAEIVLSDHGDGSYFQVGGSGPRIISFELMAGGEPVFFPPNLENRVFVSGGQVTGLVFHIDSEAFFSLQPTYRDLVFFRTSGRLTVTPPVPEPEVWALMFAGFGLLSFKAARRRLHRRLA